MKKSILAILALVAILGLSGCNNNNSSADDNVTILPIEPEPADLESAIVSFGYDMNCSGGSVNVEMAVQKQDGIVADGFVIVRYLGEDAVDLVYPEMIDSNGSLFILEGNVTIPPNDTEDEIEFTIKLEYLIGEVSNSIGENIQTQLPQCECVEYGCNIENEEPEEEEEEPEEEEVE